MTNRNLFFLYLIFALSGFSGLIYESIWSHYLKLFLGHAAYAQALVLINFMGGMALGAWLAAKYVNRIVNLFIAYALVEGVIGLFGLGFHVVFQGLVDFSYTAVFPAMDSATSIQSYKWLLSTILILPQSILLGMTFPLMSNGLCRFFPNSPGNRIAMLYFCNSIGAAIGVLVAGFYLIAKVGLPGTIMAAAILNILLAIAVYGMGKLHVGMRVKRSDQPSVIAATQKTVMGLLSWPQLLLIAAFITGMSSFIYEIAWMRMLAMVLGSTTHAFELMLSAFITGLALGGWCIHKHLDKLKNLLHVAGWVHIAMGLLALATIPLYYYIFNLMSFFVTALGHNEQGYLLFNLASHFIVLLVMLPATFCAGMTLPLFTVLLIKKQYGERSIGHIYASNTLGGIVGVVFAVFIGMPHLGLQGALLTGTSLDILLGIALLVLAGGSLRLRPVMPISFISIVLVLGIGLFSPFDLKRMASSVFRYGKVSVSEQTSLLSHYDGSTASVSVLRTGDTIAISTNGKSDGSISMNEDYRSVDEDTMILTAALPLSLHPQAKSVANIGFGTGLSTHTLLLSDTIESVETIEIEPAMVAGARFFEGKNDNAFSDPRSHIYIEDAKTYFHAHNKSYDIITSEPSNPWVSGVASLFTDEFYQMIKRYLNDGGIFVQWVQTYDSNIELILSSLVAISKNFADYQIYTTNEYDLIIIASLDRELGLPKPSIFANQKMREQLGNIKVASMHDLVIRLLGNKKILDPYLVLSHIKANSDFFPLVDLISAKARFISSTSEELQQMQQYFVPIVQFLQPNIDIYQRHDALLSKNLSATSYTHRAQRIYHFAVHQTLRDDDASGLSTTKLLLDLAKDCDASMNEKIWVDALFELNIHTVAYLYSGHLQKIVQLVTPADCSPSLPLTVTNLLGLYEAYGNRDAIAIERFSKALIAADIADNHPRKEFLFASLILSTILLDKHQQGLDSWEQQISTLYPNPRQISFPLRILGTILEFNVHNDSLSTVSSQ